MAEDRRVRLLVSVVSAEEVEAALLGGADIVDVKNPAEGSLGAPEPALLRAVRSQVASPAAVSVALGDAPHLPGTMALAAAGAASCGADYLKIGLLGSARPEQALELLDAVRRAAADVNPSALLMAAAYADASRVGALPPQDLPSIARQAGFHGVMLDTAVKDGVSTFTAMGEDAILDFLAEARGLGLVTALAGALGPADLERAQRLGADIVGVRGSACDGGRKGTVSAARVRALRATLEPRGLRARATLSGRRFLGRAVRSVLLTVSLGGLASAEPAERGTAEGTIQGGRVTVDYGRAELKGRALESLIAQLPDDRVWRAGANEVTILTTEGDLFLDSLSGSSCTKERRPSGGRRLRAGRYSVYVSAPDEGDWSLILNSDLGIELGALARVMGFPVPDGAAKRLWPHLEGYNMNRAHDVAGIAATEAARVIMRPGIANPPVDPFTIRLEPSGVNRLTLTLAWADRTWSVDLNGPAP
jgi:hypothetical protein